MTVEAQVEKIGLEILEDCRIHKSSIFRFQYWSQFLMNWSMKYPRFKVELFRFVDVLPSLENLDQVRSHIIEYLLKKDSDLPFLYLFCLKLALSVPGISLLVAGFVKKNVHTMSKGFITGENSRRAQASLKKLWVDGFSFTVDILGEAVISEEEAIDYQNRYKELIVNLPKVVKKWPERKLLEEHAECVLPRANVSVKCSSLYSQIDNFNFRGSVEAIKSRLRPLLRSAMSEGTFINLDMESDDLRNIIFTLAEEIFTEDEFKDYPFFGIVVQAYLRDAKNDLERMLALAKKRKSPLTIRLVKGAYWDTEVILAQQKDWPIPVFCSKEETDANYELCTDILLDAYPYLYPAFASHNVRSLAYAMAGTEVRALPKKAIEFQMLYGMADAFKYAVKERGFRVREYAPVGEMLPGMAYLVRRLLENTSNEGFLRAKITGERSDLELLQKPKWQEALMNA